MKRSKTETIIKAMRILADEIIVENGEANDAISEAAERLEELHATATRQCVWTVDEDYDGDTYDGACGVKWAFTDGGVEENGAHYCPHCGGKVKVAA